MSPTLVIGLDGEGSGERALAFAKKMAGLIGDCKLLIVYVVEWSPFTFQTPEENETRHRRREEEISTAMERVINPALSALEKDGIQAEGMVRHGDVADILNAVAKEVGAEQIIVSRSSEGGFTKRIFGSSTANLVMDATVPVTVIA